MLPPTPQSYYYKFPQQDTDDALKVDIDALVAFGDIDDASRAKPQNERLDEGIIGYIDTVRKFIRGRYKVTVIQLHRDVDPLVIFHHEAVDPNLLAIQIIRLIREHGGSYHFHIRNGINRYDWCHWTHFNNAPDEDKPLSDYFLARNKVYGALLGKRFRKEKPTVTLPNDDWNDARCNYYHRFGMDFSLLGPIIYFTNAEKVAKTQRQLLGHYILKNQFKRSSKIKYLFAVQDDEGENVALGVCFAPFNTGEWPYGSVFKDPATKSHYALIVNGSLYPRPLHQNPDDDPLAWTEELIQKEGLDQYFCPIKYKKELEIPMTDFILRKEAKSA